jgi:hypothetical protein
MSRKTSAHASHSRDSASANSSWSSPRGNRWP